MPGVQKKIAIGILRHIQSVEERPGFNFRALQIRRDVRNAIVGRDAMTDNPAYVARNLDDLPEILAEIFSQCAEGGMVFPFIACAISPNGNVCVFRVEPAGNEILAEHYENQPFRLPMTITVVDQKNEVAVVEIDDGGNIVRH
jgi:hypothetical protein